MTEAEWYSDEAATFGDRLAGAREAAGLSQEELARRLGVRAPTLRAWEDDRAEPRAEKLRFMSGMLGVTLGWLLTGDGEGAPAAPESADVAAILQEMRALRAEMARGAERLGQLEKRLRDALA